MKNILFMVLSFSIFLLFSCSDKEENEPFIPVDEFISAKTFLIPNKDTKVVSTILNFKNIDAIDYLRDITTVEPAHLKASGRGEYVPVADNTTQEGRSRNRRVIIKIYNSYSSDFN